MPKRNPIPVTTAIHDATEVLAGQDLNTAGRLALRELNTLADEDNVVFVQNVVLPPDQGEPGSALYVGYNINGRAIVMYEGEHEPEHLKARPHLLRVTSVQHTFHTLRELGQKWGILYAASSAEESPARSENPSPSAPESPTPSARRSYTHNVDTRTGRAG